ncbi:MAG: 3,4-dihydroxy-2-butanone-4-phosphate synthase [Phycisphaerales bacterium]|jgi:3,4-dihydroxy 2-butanone 4-phosphate synthase/GTP cyclohydrolase II|nr:3,4-dihydroxy-2-butanone-4-phosphate synthase [Phycisphaerales bacterium]
MLSPIPDILDDLRAGKPIVLVDDEGRENEGDFVYAAECVDVDAINFMTRVGGGYLCVAMAGEDCDRLDLGPQAAVNTSLRTTAFTVSVDGHPKHGVGTGISAADRTRTIQLLADPTSRMDDFVRPGHINPLRARNGGVLARTGQTEGSVDLCRLAGLQPAAAIIEIVRPDGEMARIPDLEPLCAEHGIRMCSVEQIIEHRLARETLVTRLDPKDGSPIETPWGPFRLVAFESAVDPQPHIALCRGDVGCVDAHGQPIQINRPVLTRVHRRDVLGDIFRVGEAPSADMLHASMKAIADADEGVLVYLRPEHMGDSPLSQLLHRVRRPVADDPDMPDLTRSEGVGGRAVPIDTRNTGTGSQILRELGIHQIRLLTSTERTWHGLSAFGLEIVEHVTPVGTHHG